MKMPHYDPAEDPFVSQRCFTNVDGFACLHLQGHHPDGCRWCGCATFTAFADRVMS